MEVWKDIKNFEGLYEISSFGRVKSLSRNSTNISDEKTFHYLKLCLDKKGYEITGLSKKNKQYPVKVHRLVAQHFIENPENKPEVNHKDFNKQNNNVGNLEWTTQKENREHFELYCKDIHRLPKAVNQYTLSGEYIQTFKSIKDAGIQLNISPTGISRVVNKIDSYRSAGGFKWGNANLKESSCPACGSKVDIFYKSNTGQVFGCVNCMVAVSTYEEELK